MNKNFFGILFTTLVSFSTQAQLPQILGATDDCMWEIKEGVKNSIRRKKPEEVNFIYLPYVQALNEYHIADSDFAGDPDTSPSIKKKTRESLKGVISARLEMINHLYPGIAQSIDIACKIDDLLLESWQQDPSIGGINDPNSRF